MTESESLELQLAAKAAGWIYSPSNQSLCSAGKDNATWNPRHSSHDAFQLAVKIRLSISHNEPYDQQRWVLVEGQSCEGFFNPCYIEDDFEEADRDDATRLAILRVASLIGKWTR